MAFLRPLGAARGAVYVVMLAIGLFGLTVAGCQAQASILKTTPDAFANLATRSLRDFGALGDAHSDDTAALKRALSKADKFCLDGEGGAYRVSGTLRVESDLCLRNVTILQSLVPFDTRPFITHSCPVALDASAVVDCGDPNIPTAAMAELGKSLGVRTLFIRSETGAGIRVLLDHVKIVRGQYAEGGSRTDSAGIWIEGAISGDLRNVEVTGAGKGFGLIVLRSRGVSVDNLWVHDIVWAPYAGDAPLSHDRVDASGWNSVSIHEFRQAGRGAVGGSKFYGVRVQEQVTCAAFSQVQYVTIRRPRIARCMARFEDGDLPWQADGLNISQSSSGVTVDGPVIESTWEGIDVVGNGTGIDGLVIRKPRVWNSFGFGLKLGHQVRNTRIIDPTIFNAGIAGIVLYGGVSCASISGATISGVGNLAANGRTFIPWAKESRVGIRIQEGPNGGTTSRTAPQNVAIDDVDISDGSYDFGLLNTGGREIHVRRLRATGFRKAAASGVPVIKLDNR